MANQSRADEEIERGRGDESDEYRRHGAIVVAAADVPAGGNVGGRANTNGD